MNLHDAIYTPRAREVKGRVSNTPVQDMLRRVAKLKSENVMLVDFEEMKKVETKPTKKNLLESFKSLFK